MNKNNISEAGSRRDHIPVKIPKLPMNVNEPIVCFLRKKKEKKKEKKKKVKRGGVEKKVSADCWILFAMIHCIRIRNGTQNASAGGQEKKGGW